LRELARAVGDGAPANLADAVGWHQPFYLAYQGCDDRELQEAYGKLVCRIVQRGTTPPAPRPSAPGAEPVRVGIVSGFFCQHSNWKIPISGWLRQLDRRRFRLLGYHTGAQRDAATGEAAELCANFLAGPLSAARWREAILEHAPHILIYPEIGMDPMAVRLAAERLAPVQCTSWGHPVTSGLPTLDYFLSSDLMEPDGAQAHYTERLIRLPNLSIYYEPRAGAPMALDRASLGLRASVTVFWCGQNLAKYLPQFDGVFPRIARAAGDCQFAFIAFAGADQVTALFKTRLERAFAAFGMQAAEHVVILPRLDPDRFHAAVGLSDVFLDSIGWAGCNSTLESLTHNLPIVTFTGRYMRGRHGAAILRMMGLEEQITDTLDGYVAAAVRLACNQGLRRAVGSKISQCKERVFRDRTCIAALEEFLLSVAQREPSGGR
jgi:predicted O-linked N-acetylglucosamine transferase (SPINDLY family)